MENNAKKGTSTKSKSKKAFVNKPKKAFASASNIVSIAQKRAFGASPANSVIKISRTAYPVPDVLVTKLKSSQVLTASTGASGAIASYRLYANSTFDPLGTGGGVQPRFFDQLNLLYNKFFVYGAKLSIKVLKRSAATDTVRLLAFPSVNTTMPLASLYTDGNELPKTIRFDMSAGTSGTTFPLMEDKEKSFYIDIGEFFGVDRNKLMSEDAYASTAAADPSNIMSMYIGVQTLEGATQTDVICEITMTQYVACRSVAVPAASS